MGSCTSTINKRLAHKQSSPRRKYSVYFPSDTGGVQKYAERECKQNGLNFKDIQGIFMQSSAFVILDGNFNVSANGKTTNELPQGVDPTSINPSQGRIPQNLKQGEHFTIPLQRGESEEAPEIKGKDPFQAFDFNEQPSLIVEA